MIGSSSFGAAFAHAFLEGGARRDLERQHARIDLVVGAVDQLALKSIIGKPAITPFSVEPP